MGGRGGGHSTSFDAFVPPEIALETVQLSPRAESPGDTQQADDAYVADVVALLGEHRWNGAALVGTPTHVRFPDALARIREALDLPVTSPLESGADALHALGVRRALLLSPFAPSLNQSVRDYMAAEGIELVLPTTHFASTDAAGRAGPEEIRAIVRKELASAGGVRRFSSRGPGSTPWPPSTVWSKRPACRWWPATRRCSGTSWPCLAGAITSRGADVSFASGRPSVSGRDSVADPRRRRGPAGP